MSGGVETERIRDVGGGSGGGAQEGNVGGEREVFQPLIRPSNITSSLTPANNVVSQNSANVIVTQNNNNNDQNHKKHHRRLRRQHQQHHRKLNHYAKRIRRNTQPAPNNTNEFLMKEHDHLFHLDFENEDWEGHHHNNNAPEDLNDPTNSALQNNSALHSSSEDDQDYLSREFFTTYDTVNAERLSSMTKAELISEYQLLQERVETLERRLKTAIVNKNESGPEPTVSAASMSSPTVGGGASSGGGG